jgi:hypothetical protein
MRGESSSYPKKTITSFFVPKGNELRNKRRRRARRAHQPRQGRGPALERPLSPALERDLKLDPRVKPEGRLYRLSRLGNSPAKLPVRPGARDSKCKSTKGPTLLERAGGIWKIFQRTDPGRSTPPVWYTGLHGIPSYHLRKKASKCSDKDKALGFISRMNYVLDHPWRFLRHQDKTVRQHFAARRKLISFVRSRGPIYEDGAYQIIISGLRMNTSYAKSNQYDWRRALVCTMRNFVHLLCFITECVYPKGDEF